MNWLGKLTPEEGKKVAVLNTHYKSFTVDELKDLYHLLTYNILTSQARNLLREAY